MLKFTDKEREVILHRLAVPDAIAEALTDHCEGDDPASPLPYSLLEATGDTLRHVLERGDDLDATAIAQPGVRDILAECLEGSTFYHGVEQDLQTRRMSANRVLDAIAAKLRAAGVEVGEYPFY